MSSGDRLKAIVVIWLIFGLMVGIMCNVGGTQAEEVILSLFLAVIVLAATMHLSDPEAANRLLRRRTGEQQARVVQPVDQLLNMVTDEELDTLRERLAGENRRS